MYVTNKTDTCGHDKSNMWIFYVFFVDISCLACGCDMSKDECVMSNVWILFV